MRVMNFSYLLEKEGKKRALAPWAGDALALLAAFGILGRRWRSMIKFFSGEDLKRVDFVYKMYYPVFLVKCGEYVVPVDGMALSRVRVDEYSETDGGYELFGVKALDLPLVKEAELKISEWIVATTKEEIEDGYAVSPVLEEAEANRVAKEFARIYYATEGFAERVKLAISAAEASFEEGAKQIVEEYNSLLAEYDGRVARKNEEIEGLLTGAEKKMVEELEAEIKKDLEALREERKDLNRALKESQEELRTINRNLQGCEGRRWTAEREIQMAENRLRGLISKKGRIGEGREGFDGLKNTIGELKGTERALERLRRDINGLVEEAARLKARRSDLQKKIEALQAELDRNAEKERLMPSREDMERRKINESFAKRRELLMQELNELLSEKDRRLLEIKTRENKLRRENERYRGRLNVIFETLEGELKRLRELLWRDGELLEAEVEILYIPFYLVSTDKKLSVVEPPLLIRGHGGAERKKRIIGMGGALGLIEGDWNTLSVLLYEARETFDLLNEKNRGRILRGIEALKEIKALGRTQEAILLKGCISK
ncbi:MAG: hypothetical protein FJZ49_08035 [Candidatus Verstraetearchaeota archaeon]|nr:hypothetical protein [Candidatus Verstraetearchaeota archaeon]